MSVWLTHYLNFVASHKVTSIKYAEIGAMLWVFAMYVAILRVDGSMMSNSSGRWTGHGSRMSTERRMTVTSTGKLSQMRAVDSREHPMTVTSTGQEQMMRSRAVESEDVKQALFIIYLPSFSTQYEYIIYRYIYIIYIYKHILI